MKYKYKTLIITCTIAILYPLLFLQAKTAIIFEQENLLISENKESKLDIYLDPNNEKNYLSQISLKFPSELLEISNFKFAENWLQIYHSNYSYIKNSKGEFTKTAGYPKGFDKKTKFGTITFKPKKESTGIIKISNNSFSLNKNQENSITHFPSINISPTEPPKDLFDISIQSSDTKAKKLSDILFNINLENFGTTPTPVKLIITIKDQNNLIVHKSEENITVETEKVILKTFKEPILKPGKYKVLLNTYYGHHVMDEFVTDITISKPFYQNIYYQILSTIILIILITTIILKKPKKTNAKM